MTVSREGNNIAAATAAVAVIMEQEEEAEVLEDASGLEDNSDSTSEIFDAIASFQEVKDTFIEENQTAPEPRRMLDRCEDAPEGGGEDKESCHSGSNDPSQTEGQDDDSLGFDTALADIEALSNQVAMAEYIHSVEKETHGIYASVLEEAQRLAVFAEEARGRKQLQLQNQEAPSSSSSSHTIAPPVSTVRHERVESASQRTNCCKLCPMFGRL